MKCKECQKDFGALSSTLCPFCGTENAFSKEEIQLLWQEADATKVVKNTAGYAKAIAVLAELGDVSAQYTLACLLKKGKGVAKSIPNAMVYAHAAAVTGHADAAYLLFTMIDRETDDMGLFWLALSAEFGHAVAALTYASILEEEDNKDLALFYYDKAALLGEPAAITYLVHKYLEENNPEATMFYADLLPKISLPLQIKLHKYRHAEPAKPENENLALYVDALYALAKRALKEQKSLCAVRLFSMARDLGSTKAEFYLGVCYSAGHGTEKDLKKSAECYRRAADKGEFAAMLAIGNAYKYGRGVEKCNEKALHYYEMAANTDMPEGQFVYGKCFDEGILVDRDLKTALLWYQKAAMHTHPSALQRIGEIREGAVKIFNEGVAATSMGETGQAARCYLVAAEMGNRNACCNIGNCYRNGDGVAVDKKKAAFYYQLGAREGSVAATYNLGLCYFNGEGVPYNYKLARKYLTLAQADGFAEEASAILNEMNRRQKKKKTQKLYANACTAFYHGRLPQAVAMTVVAAKEQNARAMYRIGCYYEFGDGFEKSLEKAENWFFAAANNGFAGAIRRYKQGYLKSRRRIDPWNA